MAVTPRVCAFEGRVTQFFPGKRMCFVTLSEPIGEVKRAILRAVTMHAFHLDLELNEKVKGKLAMSDACVAEVIELS